jgi:hypothetical protein
MHLHLVSGMYLTDIMYIDTIYPSTGGMDKQRTKKVYITKDHKFKAIQKRTVEGLLLLLLL